MESENASNFYSTKVGRSIEMRRIDVGKSDTTMKDRDDG